jgi:hypothetical protein
MDPAAASPRRFLGVVEVDSGTLIVGDPGYLLPRASQGKAGIDYQAVIDATDEAAAQFAGRPVLLLGRFGGDGVFPVYGEFDEYGELVRVTVEFVGPDDDDEMDADDRDL